jgi:hypothetical protein
MRGPWPGRTPHEPAATTCCAAGAARFHDCDAAYYRQNAAQDLEAHELAVPTSVMSLLPGF